MSEVNDTIHINVEYFDGNDDGDVGYPYYVASCVEIAAITDAPSLDKLLKNIREMIETHLEDVDSVAVGARWTRQESSLQTVASLRFKNSSRFSSVIQNSSRLRAFAPLR
jgi:predicted RNase H-like HicB family nuclease